jgi:amphi-Trp domain-containing protein
MGKEVVLFSSEEPRDRQAVAAFLRQLADKLEQGQVILRQGEEEVTLDIPNNVILELKAEEEFKKKKTQRTLEVEIEWVVGDEAGGPVSLG